MNRFVRLSLDVFNWLSLFFAIGIFLRALLSLLNGNIFLSRLEGNHSLIYVILFIVFVFFVFRYKEYRFLKSALSIAFLVYFHEFLFFVFTPIHVEFVQNSDYWFYWWMYGILLNLNVILILSFIVRIDKESLSVFLTFYYFVWFFILIITLWIYHIPYVFSVDNYSVDRFKFYNDVFVNMIEIVEWGIYTLLFVGLKVIR
jgi:hypothetical protein